MRNSRTTGRRRSESWPQAVSNPLRVGRIAFSNVAPVYTAFDAGAVPVSARFITGVPSSLNAQLDHGELDAGPVSAAYYLRHAERYTIVPDVCIAARDEVLSVALVSTLPPGLLAGKPIAVTRDSASGLALLNLLLRQRYGIDPVFDPVDDPLAAARAGRPTLMIGDRALDARDLFPPSHLYDLAQLWNDWTALPMVFAVWVARNDIVAERPHDVAALGAAFAASVAWSQGHTSEVIAAAQAIAPRSTALYERYFATLSYTFDAEARAGLTRFASELGFPEVSHVGR